MSEMKTYLFTVVLREMILGYRLKGNSQTIDHLLFIDDLKLCGKDESEVSSLVNTVHCFSANLRMEFRLKKCDIMYMKRVKVQFLSWIELSDGESIKRIDKECYKYLGIQEFVVYTQMIFPSFFYSIYTCIRT